MNYYELAYLASPNLSSENLNQLQERIIGEVQKEKGIIEETKPVLKKNLAYPIRKEKTAFFVVFNFHADPEGVLNLKKQLDSESEILRYLILRKEEPVKAAVPKIHRLSLKKVSPEIKKPKKPKVELEKIEKKLEEILGE